MLRLAARHDRILGEEFLEKLKAQKLEAANNANQRPGRSNDVLSQRLGVARELLEAGDMERALQFAEPALATVDIDSGRIIVLSALDNLGKGAAGQAVQCANLMSGLPETAGLSAYGVAP